MSSRDSKASHLSRAGALILVVPLVVLGTTSSGAARADVLIGPNGERLPGKFIQEKDGYIDFQSDFAGRIRVPATLAKIERDDSPAHSLQTTPVAALDQHTVSPWQIDVGAKLSVDRGSLKTSDDDLDTEVKLVRKMRHGELHGTLSSSYKRTAGELKDDDWMASFGYDRFLSDQYFAAGRFIAASELTSEGYETTGTFSISSGWRLWETPSHYLRVGPSLGYLSITRESETLNGAAVGVFARTKGSLSKHTTFNGELQVLDTLGDGRYVNLEFGLRRPIGQRLSVGLVWNYVWSDVNLQSGTTSEWRWVIGWRFGPEDSP